MNDSGQYNTWTHLDKNIINRPSYFFNEDAMINRGNYNPNFVHDFKNQDDVVQVETKIYEPEGENNNTKEEGKKMKEVKSKLKK